MSNALLQCLIGAVGDFVVMLALYAIISHFLARLEQFQGGTVSIVLIVAGSQLVWIPVALLAVHYSEFDGDVSYSAGFANWLVTGFALVLLQRRIHNLPKSLADIARLDGLSAPATWRHTVFPFVRRDLTLLAILLLMALAMASWRYLHFREFGESQLALVLYRKETFSQHLGIITGFSLVGAIPLIGLFFLARKRD